MIEVGTRALCLGVQDSASVGTVVKTRIYVKVYLLSDLEIKDNAPLCPMWWALDATCRAGHHALVRSEGQRRPADSRLTRFL